MNVYISSASSKINLFLHILGRRKDGYHDLDSLVVFSHIADYVSFVPQGALTCSASGPFGGELPPSRENLVLQAAETFYKHYPHASQGAFHIRKNLPLAAGLGGGSSDAAAALSLLAHVNHIDLSSPILYEIARHIGADVPVCLRNQPCQMSGIGDKLSPTIHLPPLYVLLINPRVKVPTEDVFRSLQWEKEEIYRQESFSIPERLSIADLKAMRDETHNDLEEAACAKVPVIAEMIARLNQLSHCLMARMSGSGPSCFALFENRESAQVAQNNLQNVYPSFWVKVGSLQRQRRIWVRKQKSLEDFWG